MADEKRWIKARMIIEIVGMPEEHVKQTLDLLAEKFGEKRRDIKVTSKKVNEPKKASEKMFSGFVEFEFEAKDICVMFGIVVDYLPSSIEIIEPEELKETSFNLNGILNEVGGRLHAYDAAVKQLKAHNIMIGKELKKYLPSQPEQKTKQ